MEKNNYNNIKSLLHYLHFLMHPCLLLVFYYSFIVITDEYYNANAMNLTMVFMGLAMSFLSLMDFSKTNSLFLRDTSKMNGKEVIEKMQNLGKFFIYLGLLCTVFWLCCGVFVLMKNDDLKVGTGCLFLAAGFIGLMKSGVEIIEIYYKKTYNL